eukprot:11886749-Heterocapsa_arctica.AAC.1
MYTTQRVDSSPGSRSQSPSWANFSHDLLIVHPPLHSTMIISTSPRRLGLVVGHARIGLVVDLGQLVLALHEAVVGVLD